MRNLLTLGVLALPLACGQPTHDTSAVPGTTTATSTTTPDDSAADETTTRDTMTTGTAGSNADSASEPGTASSTETTTTDATSTTDATTSAPSFCGDGHLDPGEECDDGDDDPMDGCKECMRDRFIFATSVEYQGGEIDGLYGADQRCRTQAALAKLPNFATYRAWLSDSTLAAADRLLHHRGRYTLVNGLVVAMDWDDLTDGQIEHPIDVTEYSETVDGSVVWTGTLASGKPAFGSSFCFDWTDDASNWDLEEGGIGICTQSDALWSYLEQGPCGATAALYCVEQ